MIEFIEYLSEHASLPSSIAVIAIGGFLLMQAIGELVEFKTKTVVPEIMKIRKFFARKRKEREALIKAADIVENCESLISDMKEVKTLFREVNSHYNPECLQQRNDWMHGVDDFKEESTKDRAAMHEMWESLANLIEKLRMQLVMVRVEQMRNAIISFARMAADETIPLTREEFNRIFKLYSAYEKLLEENGMENGEIDMNYAIIETSYEKRLVAHSFLEDMR